MWLEIDKSIFFAFEKNIRLCVAYNPPDNSKYCNKEFYDDISTNLIKHSNLNSPIILLGDLNSRTGELPDFEERDKNTDINEYNDFRRTTIPTKRNNCDKQTNAMGLKLLELCKSHDLQIINGRTFGDEDGCFNIL